MPQVGENSRGEGGISKGSDFCSSGTKKWRGKAEVSVSKGNGPLATWQVPDALNSCFSLLTFRATLASTLAQSAISQEPLNKTSS